MKLTADDLRALHEELTPPTPPDGYFTASDYGAANAIHPISANSQLRKAIGAKFGNGILHGDTFKISGKQTWCFWIE